MPKIFAALVLAFIGLSSSAYAQDGGVCPRPAAGSEVRPPADLYSQNGMLKVAFNYYTSMDKAGRTLFCFVTPDGYESPTLHVNPGDQLQITLTNMISQPHGGPSEIVADKSHVCGNATMDITSVNMHFHGTNTSPKCHSDETIFTMVNAGETFTYNLQFPKNEPPGLYWYHPHVHGISASAVEGGASGVIEVEGIANIQPIVAGLPERYLLIRDQELIAGVANTRGDPNTRPIPGWDLSLNYVPISYPHYQPSVIKMQYGAQEFWRVANVVADTVIDLKLNYDNVAQPLQIVAWDGVPIGSQDGKHQGTTITQTDILIPPAGRVEFVVTGPSKKVKQAMLVTLPIDAGPAGDVTTLRSLARIVGSDSPAHLPRMPERSGPPNPQRFAGLADAKVTAKRVLYFSEVPGIAAKQGPVRGNATEPGEPVNFYITVKGQVPRLFDPNEPPAITTHKGAVEEWIIQNRSPEVHEFHMHQIHFLVQEISGVKIPKDEQQFYDTFQVPYWDGVSQTYPYIKVKMDFRGAVVGDFVYHCHILQHEDGGMMAKIRVLPEKKDRPGVKQKVQSATVTLKQRAAEASYWRRRRAA